MSSFAAHILTSSVRSRLLAGGVVAGLLAVAALGAALFASFSYHLAGPTPAQASEALNAVMSGQPGIHGWAIASFERALRAITLVTASCAALAGLVAWLWIEPNGAHARS